VPDLEAIASLVPKGSREAIDWVSPRFGSKWPDLESNGKMMEKRKLWNNDGKIMGTL